MFEDSFAMVSFLFKTQNAVLVKISQILFQGAENNKSYHFLTKTQYTCSCEHDEFFEKFENFIMVGFPLWNLKIWLMSQFCLFFFQG